MARFLSATLVFCQDEEGRILMVQEGKDHVREKWDLPGGGLEHNETVKECAEREVEEETGVWVEANGLYGVYIEESHSTDLPVIVFSVGAEIKGEGEKDHDFEDEILDHDFLSPDEIRCLDLRKENREAMLEDFLEEEPIPIERLEDTRKA